MFISKIDRNALQLLPWPTLGLEWVTPVTSSDRSQKRGKDYTSRRERRCQPLCGIWPSKHPMLANMEILAFSWSKTWVCPRKGAGPNLWPLRIANVALGWFNKPLKSQIIVGTPRIYDKKRNFYPYFTYITDFHVATNTLLFQCSSSTRVTLVHHRSSHITTSTGSL